MTTLRPETAPDSALPVGSRMHSGPEMLTHNQNAPGAGTLLFCGGVVFALVNTAAESLYPGYSVHDDPLSLLGAIDAPTHWLWTSALVVLAVTWLMGAALLFYRVWPWLALNLLPPLGVLLVALFPIGAADIIHIRVALFVFAASGVVILADARTVRGPFRYLSIALGVVNLGVLILSIFVSRDLHLLGYGGAERIIVYPIIIWLISFGVYLMAQHL